MPIYNAKKIEETINNKLKELTNNIIDISKFEAPTTEDEKIFSNILSLINTEELLSVIHKPKATNAQYGGNTESKCDLIIKTNKNEYFISIKKNETAYLFSTNSPEHFQKMFSFFPDKIPENLKSRIVEISEKYIKKYKNYGSFNNRFNSLEEFLNEKLVDKLHKSKINNKYIDICYTTAFGKYSSEYEQKNYFLYLKEAEGNIQKLMYDILHEHNDLFKCFLHEAITGYFKFINGKGSANVIVDNSGYYKIGINDYNNPFILEKIEKMKTTKIGRLQNVPRLSVGIKHLKTIIKKDENNYNIMSEINDYIDSFSAADFTFKI